MPPVRGTQRSFSKNSTIGGVSQSGSANVQGTSEGRKIYQIKSKGKGSGCTSSRPSQDMADEGEQTLHPGQMEIEEAILKVPSDDEMDQVAAPTGNQKSKATGSATATAECSLGTADGCWHPQVGESHSSMQTISSEVGKEIGRAHV